MLIHNYLNYKVLSVSNDKGKLHVVTNCFLIFIKNLAVDDCIVSSRD